MLISSGSPVGDNGGSEGDGEEGVEIHIEERLGDGVFPSLVGAPLRVSGGNGGGIHSFSIDYILLIGMEQLRRNLGWPESLPEVCGLTFSGHQLKTYRRIRRGYLSHLAGHLGHFCCHDVSTLSFPFIPLLLLSSMFETDFEIGHIINYCERNVMTKIILNISKLFTNIKFVFKSDFRRIRYLSLFMFKIT